MSCIMPEYAVGIKAYNVWNPATEFQIQTCVAHAIHEAKTGEWEYKTILPGETRPYGWLVAYECETYRLIKRTYRECIHP